MYRRKGNHGQRFLAAALLLLSLCRIDTVRMQISSHALIVSKPALLLGLIFGCMQDLCMLMQVYSLICLYPRSRFICLVIQSLYTLPILIDLSLQYWGYPRLSYADLKTALCNFDQFLTSFKQVFVEFTSIVVIVVYVACLVVSCKCIRSMICHQFSPTHLCITALISVFSTNVILGLRLGQSAQTNYLFDNAVIGLEAGALIDLGLYVPLSSSTHRYMLNAAGLAQSVLGDYENYTLLSSAPEHQFWRKTWNYHGPKQFHIAASPSSRPYNILILNMESWSHHIVGCLTNQTGNQSLTPEFDHLAENGILFTSHYCPSSQTSRTLLTHLFGIKPKYDHEAALASQSRSLCVYGLADILKKKGYRNEFISGTDLNWHDWHWFLSHHSFHHCIDRYAIVDRLRELGIRSDEYEQQSWGLHDQETLHILQDRIEQLENTSQPYFIDYYSVSSHSPFTVPSKDLSNQDLAHPAVLASRGKTSANYKTSIIYSDRLLGQFIRSLRSKGLLNHTITIIQGDHGRGKDHRLGGNPELHMVDLLDDFQRIPLLILPPSNQHVPDPIRIDQVSNQYDIMASILDMLNLFPFQQHGMGQSLMRPQSPHRRIVLDNPINGFKLYAVVTNSFKYVFNKISEQVCVYDRVQDADELHPRCTSYKDVERFHGDVREMKIWADSIESLIDTSYKANEFLSC